MNSQPSNRPHYLNVYFQIHQPRRLGQFSFFDIGANHDYFDDGANQIIMRRIAKECYQPTNLLLLKLINKYPNIRITFSISGIALRQMERFAPAVIESFRMLAATGSVEFLSETYYHSLASLVSPDEFAAQVKMHQNKIETLFGVKPTAFRNTELIYSDQIGRQVSELGFTGMYADGFATLLQGNSPHHLYEHPDNNGLRLFFRNYVLSDDIAFRFAQKSWKFWPLTPEKYFHWLEAIPQQENLITLSMDYETFGEHQKKDTGIFQFLEGLLTKVARSKTFKMVTPSEAIKLVPSAGVISVPNVMSWADHEHDLSAWLGNDMQKDAFDNLKNLEHVVKNSDNAGFLNAWRHLQTSDHFYYMSTKNGPDGSVHNYFSPYASPYEAFMNYMNVLSDFSTRVEKLTEAPLFV